MKSIKRYRVHSASKNLKAKLSEPEKKEIEAYFNPLIEDFKIKYISKNPNKQYNYLVDIYSKWYHNYFYLCEKFAPGDHNHLNHGFEVKFVRLKYAGKNQFDFSYYRHTGQWELVTDALTLEECKEMIVSNPVFQPIG